MLFMAALQLPDFLYHKFKRDIMDTLVCYCHNFTVQDLEKDVLSHGRSTIMEHIMAESKAGNCNCAVNNPKGR
jgi:hypothetical protein